MSGLEVKAFSLLMYIVEILTSALLFAIFGALIVGVAGGVDINTFILWASIGAKIGAIVGVIIGVIELIAKNRYLKKRQESTYKRFAYFHTSVYGFLAVVFAGTIIGFIIGGIMGLVTHSGFVKEGLIAAKIGAFIGVIIGFIGLDSLRRILKEEENQKKINSENASPK